MSGTVGVELAELFPIMEEQLKAGGSVCFGPKGVSMLPLIVQGEDTVVISPINRKLKKYDVPLYRRRDGHFVLHRVVGIDKYGYIMCGDNQITREHGITDENIIGIMTEIRKPNKTILVTDKDYIAYSKKRVFTQFMKLNEIRVKSRIKKLINK